MFNLKKARVFMSFSRSVIIAAKVIYCVIFPKRNHLVKPHSNPTYIYSKKRNHKRWTKFP